MPASSLTRYAWLSIAAAIATILLKGVAWRLTGSVGLLSDAIESFVNLAGAVMALWMLALRPPPTALFVLLTLAFITPMRIWV